MAVLPAPISPTRTMLRPALAIWLLRDIGRQAYHNTVMAIDAQVEAFLEMLAAERGAARNTLAAYLADLEDFSAFAAARGVAASAADAGLIGDYLAGLAAAGQAARTQARRLSALRQFFLFLLRDGVRADNPTAEHETPKLPGSLPKYLSEAEVEALLTTAAAWPGAAG